MPMTCSICRHDEREEIEVSIVRGMPYRDIAGLYSLTKSAVARHAQEHLPAMLAKAEEAREVACAGSILDQLEGLKDSALSILIQAEKANERETALRAIREARGCVELLAKVMGELKDGGPTVNILVSPQWVQVQGVILDALTKHPAARVAVASALKQLEAPANAA